jgi:anti-sigma factor RsiW
MLCEEIENQILEYVEGSLPAAQHEEVEAHLVHCADCRAFATHLKDLDTALSASIRIPDLSSNFDQRLEERICGEPGLLTESERAERKRMLEAEFEAGMTRIRRTPFTLDDLLGTLVWPLVAVVAGWLAWEVTPYLAPHASAQQFAGLTPGMLPWLAASAVFLVIAVIETFAQRWKSLEI